MPFLSALCSALTGYLGHLAGIPLAWVLGPMVMTALFSLAGLRAFAPLPGRRAGQLIVGSTLGLTLTADALFSVTSLIPLMVISAAVAMCLGAALAPLMARFSRYDTRTCFFCLMPGGLSEMANIGARTGAPAEPIALMHAMRVALVVSVLPPIMFWLEIQGQMDQRASQTLLDWYQVPLVLMLAGAGVWLVRKTRFNNPWMVGALVAVAVVSVSLELDSQMPRELFHAGQYLIGITIGARFQRQIVRGLLPFVPVCFLFIVLLAGLLGLYALVCHWWLPVDLPSLMLATSPGGFAEMAISAELLQLNLALVTTFHITRAIMVNGLSGRLLQWLVHCSIYPTKGTER
ncbi:MAG: AbrB family transcriptional regulator [Natronospirillum sp.]|uniref:AbrB family transcriptional regulator n=1 Tax=Natronospirillum sp. TaxID=2812955 RepID=UPI0025EA46B3|nr:AbrB family transcriptional regulator [Natronospirillum sp.]MCH8552544.1 AbrB family transcriptional regulator [Natronospirillum sp.]